MSEKKYPSVVDRYYKRMYKLDMKGKEEEDHLVLVHSNRICLITLAPSHPILKQKKTVTKVDFQINKRTNRLENHLSGKRKRGAQPIADNSALCIVTCSDGSQYQPCGCIKGSLIEANTNLVTKPHLLGTKPDTEGYIAVVLTKLQAHSQEISKLLTHDQYQERRPQGCPTAVICHTADACQSPATCQSEVADKSSTESDSRKAADHTTGGQPMTESADPPTDSPGIIGAADSPKSGLGSVDLEENNHSCTSPKKQKLDAELGR